MASWLERESDRRKAVRDEFDRRQASTPLPKQRRRRAPDYIVDGSRPTLTRTLFGGLLLGFLWQKKTKNRMYES